MGRANYAVAGPSDRGRPFGSAAQPEEAGVPGTSNKLLVARTALSAQCRVQENALEDNRIGADRTPN
eukprot:7566851-Alexandrium_andersonii.AAC.1